MNSQYILLCNDLLPLFRRIPQTERYAITLGGSYGKGLSDKHSDYDFRVYYESRAQGEAYDQIMKELEQFVDKWNKLGIKVDGVWPRSILEIDSTLSTWLEGKGQPIPMEWCVWGYHTLTDIYNQAIVEDPCHIAQGWKERLQGFPDAIRDQLVKKHVSSLQYWRSDYHYKNKVSRQDTVFLASLTTRLVHDIMQILFALNRVYYPGDGLNLLYAGDFSIKPDNFEERITLILYPEKSDDIFKEQYDRLAALIEDVLHLVQEAACK